MRSTLPKVAPVRTLLSEHGSSTVSNKQETYQIKETLIADYLIFSSLGMLFTLNGCFP